MTNTPITQAWWLQGEKSGAGDAAAPAAGLTADEAQRRLLETGPNQIAPKRDRALVLQYLSRFRNPLVLILLFASAVSAVSGELANFFIIASLVLMSVTLDFVQEYRANTAAERLRDSVALRATVLRDGIRLEIPASDVVPGDVVLLAAGDLIPADSVVLESHNLFVNQAMLTGESYPVEKVAAVPPPDAVTIQDATNAVFKGTAVVSGSARVCVMRTGPRTALGAVAERISRPAPVTSFEAGTRRFGMMIMRITVLMVLFVLLVNLLFHKPWLESFLFAVALAVGLTPELLPMVMSVTLSRGAIRLAREGMIVKRQTAIQNLGSMDVLCTDKTGTLTEATVRLEAYTDSAGDESLRVLELAWVNSSFETGIKSPMDEAILAHQEVDASSWTKIDEVPFDFERRRVSVLVDHAGERWLVVKGAPDELLARCVAYETQGEREHAPIDDAAREMIRARYQALEQRGFRALAVAVRRMDSGKQDLHVDDELNLTFAGLVSFMDPPKMSAAQALRDLQACGVTIKVVTGDSDLVTRHVCECLAIEVRGVLTGAEIDRLDDVALCALVDKVNLFCRVNPNQKERVIRLLRKLGHVVGYLGDGVNDAPSLHTADVGLSVDSAVDVAKEAADIILLRPDLGVIHLGVIEGRRTFGNVMKYIMMGTSSNFGNMFSMAGSALFLPFLPMLPTQILLNNILYDLSETAIPFDRVDAADLRYPRTIDLGFIRNFMLVIGLVSSLFDFLTFYILLVVLRADEALFQTGWFVESLCTQVLVIFVIRTRGSPLATRPHPLLVFTSLAVVACALVLPFTSLGAYFGFVRPPAILYGMIAIMTATYLLMVEAVKRVFYWKMAPRLSTPAR